jgi:competence protein ComEC
MNWFRQIPFLRILLPFIAGLLISLQVNREMPLLLPLFITVFALLVVLFLFFQKGGNKIGFLLGADVLLCLFGMVLVQQHSLQWHPKYYGKLLDVSKKVQTIAVVSDVPSVKAKTIKLKLELKAVKYHNELLAVKGKLIAYVKKHHNAHRLKAGQQLYVHVRLQETEAPRNPGEFDYKHYLHNRQIYHVAFLDSGDYAILSSPISASEIRLLALHCKQWIVERLRNSSLSREAFSITSALLTGFDEEIGPDILKAFAHSGTLHVLSVSGLHTGLIFVFLSVVFDFFDPRRKRKVLKFSLLISVLWAFALLTGLAAPVLRSVVMLSLFAIGSVFFRNEPKNQLNLLFVSAFVLLCANPYFLTEVGFQLSFSALFGLIVFEPFFSAHWQPQRVWLRWLWKSTCASFAATISTLPFTLYYFKQFPLWFFIANPVVVPASFLLLALSVPALFHWQWVLWCINWLTEKLIQFITLFDSGKLSYIDGIPFKFQDAVWISVLIALLSSAIYRQSFRQLVYSLCLFLIWQVSALVQDFDLLKKNTITVYSVNKAYAYSVKQGQHLSYSVSDAAVYERYVKAHALTLGNPHTQDDRFNAIETSEYQLVILNQKGSFPEVSAEKPTYLVLSNDFYLKEVDFSRFKRLRALVLDESMQRKSLGRVEKLCRKFGLLCYQTKKQGALILNEHEIENWR